MHVVLGTIVRDGAGYFDRFAGQVNELAKMIPDFRAVVLVNDCTDDTPDRVKDWADNGADFPVKMIRLDTGAPLWPSVDIPERWANFSQLGDRVMREIRWPDEVLLYTYPDLIWPDVRKVYELCERAAMYRCAFAAAVTKAPDPDFYYDTWGTIAGGMKFGSHWPWHHTLDTFERFVPVDSVAGMIAVPAQIAAGSKWGYRSERSWCANIRELGCSIQLDIETRVVHP